MDPIKKSFLQTYSTKLNVCAQIKIFNKLNKHHLKYHNVNTQSLFCQLCTDCTYYCEQALNEFLLEYHNNYDDHNDNERNLLEIENIIKSAKLSSTPISILQSNLTL